MWLAEEAPDIFQFAQFGVLGLFVIAFIMGWIWPKPSVDRILKDNERMSLELERRNKIDSEVIIPVLISSKDLILRMETRIANGSGAKK